MKFNVLIASVGKANILGKAATNLNGADRILVVLRGLEQATQRVFSPANCYRPIASLVLGETFPAIKHLALMT